MNAFGSRPEEQMLTDQIDDEYDVMNDETFGGEVPNDEWEVEQATDDIESNDAVAAAAAAMLERSMLDFAAARLPMGDDPLDFLEQSISQMVEDDDDLMFRGQRKSSNSKPLTDIFAPGSPQTPFFQLDKSNSIWSESTLKKPAPQANANAPSAATVSGLFERLRVNGGENFGGLPPPTEQAPILVKGAKTAEELEAEMFGMSIPPSTNRSISIDPAIQQSQQPPKVMIKSCQELEREFIESSRAAAAMATLARQQSMPENVANFAQQPPTMPPAALAQQQIQNMLIRQPPPPPHAMLANPQVRAALMARWMAANPGAMPPVWFRMPPPPMMPPPGAGFCPPIIRPGQNMAQMNFNNARMPQQQPPHGVDPRAAIGFMFQQGVRRTSPNFPKRRLFDSPNRFGHDNHYEHRDNRNNRGREREYYIQDPNDPFAGLMSRRERSWLIKIQTLQLYSENPYVDDYYWMMYRRRKAAATDGNSLICKDADHNDNFEHRVYVPPQFEGSLGKVQVLSANFPRQVLDLAASSTNGDGKQQSTDDGSPRDSPPIKGGMQTVAGRRLKNVLIEIENLYLMLLEANDLTIMQEQNASSGTADDTREKTSARIKHLVQTILAALVTEDRIVSAISIRKGRRLLFQLAVHCTNDDCFKIMQAILGNLLPIAKREPHEEVFAVIQMITDSKLKTLNETDWSLLWEAIKIDTIENVLKYKLGNLIFLLLLQRLAVANITLSEGALKAVERWATVVYTNFTSSNNDEKGRAFTLEKRQAELLSSWLKNTSVPASVVDAIELRLTV